MTDEIDEALIEIEKQIEQNEEILEELSDIPPRPGKYSGSANGVISKESLS